MLTRVATYASDLSQLSADAGVRQVNLGAALVRAALTAVVRGAREVQELGTFGFEADAFDYDEIVAFMAKPPS